MKRKALVVTDLQNDFIDEAGALFSPESRKALQPSLYLIDRFRDQHLPIITTQDWHFGKVMEFELFGPHCVADSYGAKLVAEVEEALKDYDRWIRIYKPLFSALEQTPLDHYLREMGIEQVHVCGVTTHICVHYTVEGLFYKGYEVVVYHEAVSSFNLDLHDYALKQMRECFGIQFASIQEGD